MNKAKFQVQIKEISESGTFEGDLSVYNVVDQGKDMVVPGAFTKTIKEHGAEVPLLWQHKADSPIGKLTLVDGPDALKVKGSLLMELPDAQKAYLLMKAGIVKGLSIGYDPIKDLVENGVRKLKEVRLYEGSVVTFPMNEMSLITSVKANQKADDFNTELMQIQLESAGYQMRCALGEALDDLTNKWDEDYDAKLTDEERVSAAGIVLEQFSTAYMDYLPRYLALIAADGAIEGEDEIQTMSRKARKEGRRISADTQKSLAAMHDHMSQAVTMCKALMVSEAEGPTPTFDKQAASPEQKSEPESIDPHSAAQSVIERLMSLIPAA